MSLFQTMYHKITHHFLPEKGQLRVKVRRLAAVMWRLDTSNQEDKNEKVFPKLLTSTEVMLYILSAGTELARLPLAELDLRSPWLKTTHTYHSFFL